MLAGFGLFLGGVVVGLVLFIVLGVFQVKHWISNGTLVQWLVISLSTISKGRDMFIMTRMGWVAAESHEVAGAIERYAAEAGIPCRPSNSSTL